MREYLKLMRVKHYMKNLLIFKNFYAFTDFRFHLT